MYARVDSEGGLSISGMGTEPARLICLRHAEAERTTTQRTGLPDPSLTARGRDQAAAAASRLRHARAGMVYASPAIRSRQTAAIIAEQLSLQVAVLPALSETACSAQVLESWIVHGDLKVRVADGETGYAVASRVTAALAAIAAACADQPAVVVGHVASLTIAISVLCGNGPSLWGVPLPHAIPFPLTRAGARWHVQWPTLDVMGAAIRQHVPMGQDEDLRCQLQEGASCAQSVIERSPKRGFGGQRRAGIGKNQRWATRDRTLTRGWGTRVKSRSTATTARSYSKAVAAISASTSPISPVPCGGRYARRKSA
jgi:broad specificity phosphatase PhoE